MMKLNRRQRIGLILLFGGFAAYIVAALLLPTWRIVWLTCWGVSLAGILIYASGTIPSLVEWIRRARK